MNETLLIKGKNELHFFSDNEIGILLEKARACDPQIYLLFKLLWETGVRISEALEIKPEHINGHLIMIQTKLVRSTKEKTRVLKLSDDLIEVLTIYIKRNKIRKNSRVFRFTSRTAQNYIKKICGMACINDERAHPATLRHSHAIYSLKQGIRLDKINYNLGNRDIKKTMRYLQLIDYTS